MKSSTTFLLGVLAVARNAVAAGVTGSPVGFATGTTGGGSATPVYPSTIKELTAYLTDSSPRVIILQKEYAPC